MSDARLGGAFGWDARLWGILAAALVAGICSGLFGIGGGTLLVPLLVLIFGFGQQRAQGTSLVALVPPTGLLAFMTYYHAHQVDLRVGMLIIPGVFVGGFLGGRLANALSPHRMRITFAAFLFLLGAWQVVSAWTR
jgi:uncharacterized membrane protein YfcA